MMNAPVPGQLGIEVPREMACRDMSLPGLSTCRSSTHHRRAVIPQCASRLPFAYQWLRNQRTLYPLAFRRFESCFPHQSSPQGAACVRGCAFKAYHAMTGGVVVRWTSV
jgi:hypothetical protein